jgi:large subunit ribosomal protein L15
MQIQDLKPIHKNSKKKRIGRGGKKGTYSGRGLKGQKSRAGRKMMPMVREIIKRYPKLKGYRARRPLDSSVVLNLNVLQNNFKDSEIVNPKTLLEKGLIRRIIGRVPEVKILGDSEIKKKIIIEGCKVSKSAREKIEKAGGEIK